MARKYFLKNLSSDAIRHKVELSASAGTLLPQRFCKKCGQPFKWERFTEAKWQRVNSNGTPHRESCSAVEVPAKSALSAEKNTQEKTDEKN